MLQSGIKNHCNQTLERREFTSRKLQWTEGNESENISLAALPKDLTFDIFLRIEAQP